MALEEVRVREQVLGDGVIAGGLCLDTADRLFVHAGPRLVIAEFNVARKGRHGRSREPYRLARTRPAHTQSPTPHVDLHVRCERTVMASDDDRRAGAGAAGECLTNSALVYAQPDVRRRDDLEKPRVDVLGKRS